MFLLDSLQSETGIKELWLNQYRTGLFYYPAHSQVHSMFRNQENKDADNLIHRKCMREMEKKKEKKKK